jgi:hypothetical protein
MMMSALVTIIAVFALVFFIEIWSQQPQGISNKVLMFMFQKSPIAAGVTTAVLTTSPFCTKETLIGSSTPPSAAGATATFAVNDTLYKALQHPFFVIPLILKTPDASLCRIMFFLQHLLPFKKAKFPPCTTVCSKGYEYSTDIFLFPFCKKNTVGCSCTPPLKNKH